MFVSNKRGFINNKFRNGPKVPAFREPPPIQLICKKFDYLKVNLTRVSHDVQLPEELRSGINMLPWDKAWVTLLTYLFSVYFHCRRQLLFSHETPRPPINKCIWQFLQSVVETVECTSIIQISAFFWDSDRDSESELWPQNMGPSLTFPSHLNSSCHTKITTYY